MKRYMLDTNMVSFLIKKHPAVAQKIMSVPMGSVCVSAVTAGELLFGIAKRPEAKMLHRVVHEFLRHTDILPWDDTVAQHYGGMRAELQNAGNMLAPLDLLIASHARSVGAVLVTNDHAFDNVSTLRCEDWTLA